MQRSMHPRLDLSSPQRAFNKHSSSNIHHNHTNRLLNIIRPHRCRSKPSSNIRSKQMPRLPLPHSTLLPLSNPVSTDSRTT